MLPCSVDRGCPGKGLCVFVFLPWTSRPFSQVNPPLELPVEELGLHREALGLGGGARMRAPRTASTGWHIYYDVYFSYK